MTTIYIVRHGQSHGNVDVVLREGDPHLTDIGKDQIKEVAKKLIRVHFDAIFSSDLTRAIQTAKIINLKRKLILKTIQVLRERNFGSFYKNKNREEIKIMLEHLKAQIYKIPQEEFWKYKMIDDMESEEEAVSRFITALREIAIAYDGKTVLIIGHGNMMRSFLTHLGFATFRELPSGSVKNAGYIRLESDGIDFFVKETVGVTKKATP